MKIIIGLGNPGGQYEGSRHNIGFHVLDSLLEDLLKLDKTYWEKDKYIKSLLKKVVIGNEEIVLCKPQLYMNNSGFVVSEVLKKYNFSPLDAYIVYDDLDLPFGKIRIRFGGAAGGHKGVESIIKVLDTDKFLRIRLGIGRPSRHEGSQRDKSTLAVDDYVLSSFSPNEKGKVRTMTKEAIKTIKVIVKDGIDLYMSKYNKK